MGHDSTRIWAPVEVGPNVNDVGAVLGVPDRSYEALCKSDKINKWSKYKPIEFNAEEIITDDNRETAHHGFVVSPSSTDTIFEYSLASLFARYASNNGEYKYIKPSTWFRILDFVPTSLSGMGYNHNAPAPFVYNNPSQASSILANYMLTVTLNSALNSEISIADIINRNTYQSDMSKWYISLACKYTKSGSTYYKLARAKTTDGQDTPRTLADFVKGEQLYAELGLDGFRTYEMLWVATEIDPSAPDDPGACVYLPLGGFAFTLNQASMTINYTFAWSGGGPQGAAQYAYNKKGEWVRCCAVNFSSAFSRVTMAQVAPESRTATIYSTPILHLRDGGTVACERIQISSAGAVSVNQTIQQTIDTTLVGTVLCKEGGENVAVSDISYIELITQVEIDAGGNVVIVLANSNGDQTDNLYIS